MPVEKYNVILDETDIQYYRERREQANRAIDQHYKARGKEQYLLKELEQAVSDRKRRENDIREMIESKYAYGDQDVLFDYWFDRYEVGLLPEDRQEAETKRCMERPKRHLSFGLKESLKVYNAIDDHYDLIKESKDIFKRYHEALEKSKAATSHATRIVEGLLYGFEASLWRKTLERTFNTDDKMPWRQYHADRLKLDEDPLYLRRR